MGAFFSSLYKRKKDVLYGCVYISWPFFTSSGEYMPQTPILLVSKKPQEALKVLFPLNHSNTFVPPRKNTTSTICGKRKDPSLSLSLLFFCSIHTQRLYTTFVHTIHMHLEGKKWKDGILDNFLIKKKALYRIVDCHSLQRTIDSAFFIISFCTVGFVGNVILRS